MLTVIIENYAEHEDALKATLASLEHLQHTALTLHTVVLSKADKHTLHTAVASATDSYICILKAGDTLSVKHPKVLVHLLAAQTYSVIRTVYLPHSEKRIKTGRPYDLNLTDHPEFVPAWLYNHIFHKDVFAKAASHTRYAMLLSLYRHLAAHPDIYYMADIVHSCGSYPDSSRQCSGILKKSWYLDFANDLLEPLILQYEKEQTALPIYLQYTLLRLIWFRFQMNMNNGDKHVIDAEYPQFEDCIYRFLQQVDDDVIFNTVPHSAAAYSYAPIYDNNYNNRRARKVDFHNLEAKVLPEGDTDTRLGYRTFTLPKHFMVSLLQLKYKDSYRLTYEIIQNEEAKTGDIFVQHNDHIIQKISALKCNLDLMDYDASSNRLTLEFHIDNFVQLPEFDLQVRENGQLLSTEETYRYTLTKYFGISAQRSLTYRTTLTPDTSVKADGNIITWALAKNNITVPLQINAKHYCARVSSLLHHSYWHFGSHMIALTKNNTALKLTPAAHHVLKNEFLFYLTNIRSFHSIGILGLRTLYWLTHPWMKKKTIWLTYDKLYKGGDCGEYLYKYCCIRQAETGITPAYVINGDSDDYKRLRAEGYHPLKYRSVKHFLYYLNSSVVFTTHGGVFNFNGFSKRSIRHLQNLLHHDVACIQHGLTVQQLAHNSNRLFNNMKRYYCASKYEIENLSQPAYGYEDTSVLKLTGIPRYDGLVNNDKRQILITPTWRNYIALPAAAKNQAKPYFAGFKKTDYFKIYNKLLSDPKLIETAKRTGYRLIYLLHPVISAQLKDYPQNDFVDIVPSLTVNYEKILTESSLMVTDYSGVQFDFAYMRKPVIYYHPPKLPPHYKEGGFFYDTMGFGEICTAHKEMVDTLCRYMESECQVTPFYRAREDDFFAYDDLNSCQRIYDDMLEYQKRK